MMNKNMMLILSGVMKTEDGVTWTGVIFEVHSVRWWQKGHRTFRTDRMHRLATHEETLRGQPVNPESPEKWRKWPIAGFW